VIAKNADGRPIKMLTILNEYSRECLAILVERRLTFEDVVNQLYALFLFRGVPEDIRSDTAPSSPPWRYAPGSLT